MFPTHCFLTVLFFFLFSTAYFFQQVGFSTIYQLVLFDFQEVDFRKVDFQNFDCQKTCRLVSKLSFNEKNVVFYFSTLFFSTARDETGLDVEVETVVDAMKRFEEGWEDDFVVSVFSFLLFFEEMKI